MIRLRHGIAALLLAVGPLMTYPAVAGPFFLQGIREGMTRGEYERMIEQGRYTSKALDENLYAAKLDGSSYLVSFCSDRVVSVTQELSSLTAWLNRIASLKQDGFALGQSMSDFDSVGEGTSRVVGVILQKAGEPYAVEARLTSFAGAGLTTESFLILYFDAPRRCTASR